MVQETEGILFTKQVLVENCQVILRSGTVLRGRRCGLPMDATIDLALVAVDSPALYPLGTIRPFGEIRKGERVVAIGHPLGIDFTITEGIISNKIERLILTSTPINHGNSGGPLVDQTGQVVGVNTFIVRVEGAEGMGFAIRADIACKPSAWTYSEDVADLVRKIAR